MSDKTFVVTFTSPRKSLRLQRKGGQTTTKSVAVSGVVVQETAPMYETIQFNDGRFQTEDPEIIADLRNHKWFGVYFFETERYEKKTVSSLQKASTAVIPPPSESDLAKIDGDKSEDEDENLDDTGLDEALDSGEKTVLVPVRELREVPEVLNFNNARDFFAKEFGIDKKMCGNMAAAFAHADDNDISFPNWKQWVDYQAAKGA